MDEFFMASKQNMIQLMQRYCSVLLHATLFLDTLFKQPHSKHDTKLLEKNLVNGALGINLCQWSTSYFSPEIAHFQSAIPHIAKYTISTSPFLSTSAFLSTSPSQIPNKIR